MKLAKSLLSGLLVLSMASGSPANDGHLHNSTSDSVRSQNTIGSPRNGQPASCCPSGNCPLESQSPPIHIQDPRSTASDVSRMTTRIPHEAISLAIQLELATEILGEEVLYLADQYGRHDTVDSLMYDLVSATGDIRRSLEERAPEEHLSAEIESLKTILQKLGQHVDLQWNRSLRLASDRVSGFQDELAFEIGSSSGPFREGRPADVVTPDPIFELSPSRLPSNPANVKIPSDMRGITELPLGDQSLALEQGTCPVTGEPLGSMGKPIKVTVGDRIVFVCCQGCVNRVRSNSEPSPREL